MAKSLKLAISSYFRKIYMLKKMSANGKNIRSFLALIYCIPALIITVSSFFALAPCRLSEAIHQKTSPIVDLKNKLRNHNGLSIKRKKKFIDVFLRYNGPLKILISYLIKKKFRSILFGKV